MKNILLIFAILSSELLFGQTATAPSSGNGTSANPYQIATLENLYWITASSTRWTAYYRQTDDIDATATITWDSNQGWSPIGNSTTQFTGSYDGNGHTISNLYMNRGNYTGLFGYTAAGSSISNLGLLNTNITGTGFTGSVAGENYSSVTNCYSTGTISGAGYVGGLFGDTYGTVSNSYSSCNVMAGSAGGGFTGGNSGAISNCYSTGNVTRKSGYGGTGFGGFVGYKWSNISYCFSTGSVTYEGTTNPTDKGFVGTHYSGSYTENFFDRTTSGQTTSNEGYAVSKTTAQMQTQSTFTNAGWNFASLWKIIGTNYPSLHPVIYVNTSAAGKNNGTSWTNAYTSFQPALDLAAAYQQIWVAKGTYKPSYAYDLTNTSRYYHFRMIDGVAIYGGFAGTETDISQRLNFATGLTNETILSGDIGTADDNTDNCYHVFYHPDSYGLTSSAVLNGFTIKNAYAEDNSGASHLYRGGGMHNGSGNNPIIEYCTFNSNTAGNGGGIYNKACSPSISNCIFSNNSALNLGGGVYLTTSSNTTLTNCLVINNNAVATGGGIYLYATDIATDACNPVITNTTIAGNTANLCGGIRVLSSTATLNNCIIWGNTHTNIGAGSQIYMSGTGSSTALNYSCYSNEVNDVFGSPTTSNCITTNPQFAGSGDYPFSIVGISPCADAGNNTYNSTLNDIRGTSFSRKLNKADGTTGTIDMGAYEYQFGSDPLPVELTSFNANVDGNKVLLNWQTATEVNNYGFEIERKPMDGIWSKIGFVQSYGNSNSPKNYFFEDNTPVADHPNYRLKQIDKDGKYEYSNTVEVNTNAPAGFSLDQNYPNPFNPSTMIRYQLPVSNHVTLKLYDVLGREIATLINKYEEAGTHSFRLSIDEYQLTCGVYMYSINAGNGYSETKKLMVIK